MEITPKKAWNAMTQPERAVMVAKDVLSIVDVLDIRTGTCYLQFNRWDNPERKATAEEEKELLLEWDLARMSPEELQKILFDPEILRRCTACARGAAFIARARLFNEVKFGYEPGEANSDSLDGIFSEDQQQDIEEAFERESLYYIGKTGGDRLRAVFQNVIDNNGTFIIPKSDDEWED